MKDPKKFAKTKKSDYAEGNVGCGTGLAGKICRHNQKKLNHFVAVKKAQIKKSVDFKDTLVSVDAADQLLAEKTANPVLVRYIQNNIAAQAIDKTTSSARIPFPNGILTLTAREAGIYNGFFQDADGQVIEKFDAQTAAIIAKTLQMKSIIPDVGEPQSVPVGAPAESPSTTEIAASAAAAAHDRIDMVHNRIDALQKQVINQVKGLRIKYGDFELEIRKSVQGFIGDFKAGRTPPDKDVVRKALTSWRKHSVNLQLGSDQQAARELMENWDQYQDSFCQFVDAISRGDDEQG